MAEERERERERDRDEEDRDDGAGEGDFGGLVSWSISRERREKGLNEGRGVL